MVEAKNLKYNMAIIYLLELYLLIRERLYPALHNWQSLVKGPTQIGIIHLANGPHSHSLDFLAGIWARPIHYKNCLANGSDQIQLFIGLRIRRTMTKRGNREPRILQPLY